MADYFDEPEPAWDEYDWERFLQQQDSKTERYMELFEKYIDDPNRDQIIAREMGWPHLLEPTSDELEEIEFEGDSADESEEADKGEGSNVKEKSSAHGRQYEHAPSRDVPPNRVSDGPLPAARRQGRLGWAVL